jgi:nicotinamidase-related amidase
MSDAQGMEQFFRERGFGQLIGWGDSPALLVIDFTRAFTNPALPLGSNLDRELAETVRILGAAREAAIPIYYSSVCYEDKDLRDAGLWAKKIAGTMTLRAGTPEVEIDPRWGAGPTRPSSSRSTARSSSARTC